MSVVVVDIAMTAPVSWLVKWLTAVEFDTNSLVWFCSERINGKWMDLKMI